MLYTESVSRRYSLRWFLLLTIKLLKIMKVKHILIIILTILYFYWLSDIYIFIYNNNVYDPGILDDTFTTLKVLMYLLNYLLIIPILVILHLYTDFISIIAKILNTPIKFKKYEN